MLDLSAYASKQNKDVTVTLDDGDSFTVTINAAKATERFFLNAKALAGGDGDLLTSLAVAKHVIVGLVTDWGITVDGTQPLPVTAETVEELPVAVTGAIVAALFEAESPGND